MDRCRWRRDGKLVTVAVRGKHVKCSPVGCPGLRRTEDAERTGGELAGGEVAGLLTTGIAFLGESCMDTNPETMSRCQRARALIVFP